MPSKTTSLPASPEFLRLARKHTLIPLYRTLTADLETPVSAFLRLAAHEPECFLLESVEGGEKIGRYTYIGIRPYRRIVSRGRSISITEEGETRELEGDIFEVLKESLDGHSPAVLPELPPFTCGAVGYFTYDVVRQIEKLPEEAADELEMPDACLLFFDEVLAFDHVRKEMLLLVTADLQKRNPKQAYAEALWRLDRFEKRLLAPLPKQKKKTFSGKLKLANRTKKKDFLKAIERSKEYIAAGDIFQVVVSQRFDVEPEVDPFSIYRALRIVNPSPFLYFLRSALPAGRGTKTETTHIVGSSPELLVRVQNGRVEYRPIAGTRPRGEDEAADRAYEQDMLHDEKERAEHVMLVDLGRNDVGRVSEYGSVQVGELMRVERYSHVMHLVSDITGTLRKGLNAVDALRACFPAGTLSGAPKIRAMEIIEEMEPARRGIYGGCVLYADFSGNLTSCIAIRTLLMKGRKGYIQAGAGIVADSVPEKEYEESVNKAKAVVRAIERARA
uniref:Anthranilate synthase component 1 n=1 Tax=Acidobacterium capsulatum TaxID=33075 RepID=A0A7V4XSN0_9BACT